MANPYQPPRHTNRHRAEQSDQQPIRTEWRQASIAAIYFLVTAAIVGALMLQLSRWITNEEIGVGACAAAAFFHTVAWAVVGYQRYGCLGVFALTGIAFVTPCAFAWFFSLVSLSMPMMP